MRVMLDDILPRLAVGTKTISRALSAGDLAEGSYAATLRQIAAAHPDVSIGSYPSFADGRFRNEVLVRGKFEIDVDAAARSVLEMFDTLRKQPK